MYLARAHAEDQRPGSLPYTRSGHPLLPFLAPRTSTKMHPIEQGRPVKPEAGSRALPSRWLQVRGWGIGSCLLQPSATHPGLQASPWVSKQEAAQRGVLFFPVTSLPSSPSFKQRRGSCSEKSETTPPFTRLRGRRQGAGRGGVAELAQGPPPLRAYRAPGSENPPGERDRHWPLAMYQAWTPIWT